MGSAHCFTVERLPKDDSAQFVHRFQSHQSGDYWRLLERRGHHSGRFASAQRDQDERLRHSRLG